MDQITVYPLSPPEPIVALSVSEGSLYSRYEILRFAQHDNHQIFWTVVRRSEPSQYGKSEDSNLARILKKRFGEISGVGGYSSSIKGSLVRTESMGWTRISLTTPSRVARMLCSIFMASTTHTS